MVIPMILGSVAVFSPPAHLLQEGGLLPEVLGHHVEAEEVAVDAHPGHGQAVQALVLLCCILQ